MDGLMNKTKRELVDMIKELETRQPAGGDDLARVVEEKEAAIASLKGKLDKLKRGQRSLSDSLKALEEEKISLLAEKDCLTAKLAEVAREAEQLDAERHAQADLAEACDEHSTFEGLIMDALTDFGGKSVLLLDQTYSVRFANRSAAALLAQFGCESVEGCTIFDLLFTDTPLKLKERFDKCLLEGEKEKIKKVVLCNGDIPGLKVTVKLSPARLGDDPALLMQLKAAD